LPHPISRAIHNYKKTSWICFG